MKLPWGFVALIFLLGTPALADSYLVYPNLVGAQARSQSQCQANGCDGVHTIYWWNVIGGPAALGGWMPPDAASAAIVVDSAYYAQQGLTTAEQALIQTPAQLTTGGWKAPISATAP